MTCVRCTTAVLASGQSHISVGAALKGCRSRRTIHALHAEEITSCETRRVKASLGIMPLCTIEFTRADIASETVCDRSAPRT